MQAHQAPDHNTKVATRYTRDTLIIDGKNTAFSCVLAWNYLHCFLRRFRLLLLACSFSRRGIERLGLHVGARFAESVAAQHVLTDGAVIFGVQLRVRSRKRLLV